jgi:hypothetical protein
VKSRLPDRRFHTSKETQGTLRVHCYWTVKVAAVVWVDVPTAAVIEMVNVPEGVED